MKAFRKEKDPIKFATECIISSNLATEQELKDIDNEVKQEMEEGVRLALSGPVLPTEELYTDIHVNTPKYSVRGCDPFTWGHSELTKLSA